MALRDVSEFFLRVEIFLFRLQVSARIGHKPAFGRSHKVSKHSLQLGKRWNRSRSSGGGNVCKWKLNVTFQMCLLLDVFATHVRWVEMAGCFKDDVHCKSGRCCKQSQPFPPLPSLLFMFLQVKTQSNQRANTALHKCTVTLSIFQPAARAPSCFTWKDYRLYRTAQMCSASNLYAVWTQS